MSWRWLHLVHPADAGLEVQALRMSSGLVHFASELELLQSHGASQAELLRLHNAMLLYATSCAVLKALWGCLCCECTVPKHV